MLHTTSTSSRYPSWHPSRLRVWMALWTLPGFRLLAPSSNSQKPEFFLQEVEDVFEKVRVEVLASLLAVFFRSSRQSPTASWNRVVRRDFS